MNEILPLSSSSWLGFAVALIGEVVVLGVPCVAVAPRASREWLARLTDPRADVRLDWSEWAALVGIGLTLPGLGMLTLARLVRTAPRAWRRRQLALVWVCCGAAAFGLFFFGILYALLFSGPVGTLGLANLAAGAIGVPLLALALTLAWLLGRQSGENSRAIS
ncbi:MAG TPA: hypothetical protein VF746_22390 [Longimicrobium sp.]|jgi:hypothetical protein